MSAVAIGWAEVWRGRGLAVGLLAVGFVLSCAPSGGPTEGDGLPSWFDALTGTVAGDEVSVGDGGTGGDPGATPAPGVPALGVSVTELDFTMSLTHRTFEVSASGSGSLAFGVRSSVPWATVDPGTGTIAGGTSAGVGVSVDIGQLGTGEHAGLVTVVAQDGQARQIAIRAVISPPGLTASAALLSYGATETARTLALRNVGDGVLGYEVTADVPWVTIAQPGGQVSNAPVTVEVAVDRRGLLIGPHTANLTVTADNGQKLAVAVELVKEVTSPKVVPWLDLNIYDPVQVSACRDGLRQWQYVTDAAIIEAGRDIYFYANMRAEFSHLEIVPGTHTRYALQGDAFDTVAGWQTVAADVIRIAAAAGTNRVLLDHEYSLVGYNQGTMEIDMDQLREALSYMPTDIQIIWYPGIYPNSASAPNAFARSRLLCETVNGALSNVRFVDLSYGGHDYAVPAAQQVRDTLESFAVRPTMPIVWYGCSPAWCYWEYSDLPVIMQALAGRPDVNFYPVSGASQWLEMAGALVPQLNRP